MNVLPVMASFVYTGEMSPQSTEGEFVVRGDTEAQRRAKVRAVRVLPVAGTAWRVGAAYTPPISTCARVTRKRYVPLARQPQWRASPVI